MYKQFGAVVLAASLFVSSAALAAEGANQGALAPGKPATVKQASWILLNGHWVWLVGGAFVVGGVALAASGGGGGHGTVSTTTTGTGSGPN